MQTTCSIDSKRAQDYDPAASLHRVEAAVLSINFADDEINPPELGFIERAKSPYRTASSF
jgi:hypothetical protein